MPVRMRKVERGQHKGQYTVVEPDGTVVFGPTTKQKARSVVAGRNLGERRSKGKPTPRRRHR